MPMSPPSTPKIAIIVLNWNGKQDTLACLTSLMAIHYPVLDIILVDNGSTDGSVSVIKEQFPNVHCIELPSNVGFAAGNNAGIEYALNQNAQFFLLLNNDTVVAPDLLDHFMDAFAQHPQAGIIGARIYLFDKKDTLDHLGGIWLKKQADVRLIGFHESDGPPDLAALPALGYGKIRQDAHQKKDQDGSSLSP